jgi:hypothetical protein
MSFPAIPKMFFVFLERQNKQPFWGLGHTTKKQNLEGQELQQNKGMPSGKTRSQVSTRANHASASHADFGRIGDPAPHFSRYGGNNL